MRFKKPKYKIIIQLSRIVEKIEAAVEVIDLVVCLFASLDFGCVDPNLKANRSMDDLLVRHLQYEQNKPS